MSATSEVIRNIYDLKWAKTYGIALEDVEEALKMIGEIMVETDYDEDDILATYLYLYHKSHKSKLPESILDKFAKIEGKNIGKLVKFTKY